MALTLKTQFIETMGDVMNVIAPNAGGSIPDENSEEFAQWKLAIQFKYEEASKRGFWRALLTKETDTLRAGDTEYILPIRFQRANSLYIFAFNGVDYADPDRVPDGQSVQVQMINDPEDEDFGTWKVIFENAITADTELTLWYFATPPKPNSTGDKLLLPGDMVAFGAMAEIFRTKNLPGSQDDARAEYENRLSTYLAMQMIPPRNELVTFESNPRGLDRTKLAKSQWQSRPGRSRNF